MTNINLRYSDHINANTIITLRIYICMYVCISIHFKTVC